MVETPPSTLDTSELPFNGMHGSCCVCGDKYTQKEAVKAKAWGSSGFWKKGMGHAKKRGIEWVPLGRKSMLE